MIPTLDNTLHLTNNVPISKQLVLFGKREGALRPLLSVSVTGVIGDELFDTGVGKVDLLIQPDDPDVIAMLLEAHFVLVKWSSLGHHQDFSAGDEATFNLEHLAVDLDLVGLWRLVPSFRFLRCRRTLIQIAHNAFVLSDLQLSKYPRRMDIRLDVWKNGKLSLFLKTYFL